MKICHCGASVKHLGLCSKHYHEQRRRARGAKTRTNGQFPILCPVCGRSFNVGWRALKRRRTCSDTCRYVWRSQQWRGALVKNWKGGRWVSKQGYVRITGGMATTEHRCIMARHLGRPLLRTEVVHHKDGNKTNNT